ncbi:formyltetrahydrofolate deformylase [Yunchengibacter salinarum]|uniref:formyltetrahydrofolate deformylase n=1 Tax=Yunchengibacter salinarum TaxID=3133399 RepID=UPI0035B5F9DD
MTQKADTQHVLVAHCPDSAGISADVTGFLARHGAFITDTQSFGCPVSKRFFMRIVFRANDGRTLDSDSLKEDFGALARRRDMAWQMVRADRPARTVIAVSRSSHCLNNLLHRWHLGTLPIDIAAVVSNHEDCRALVEWYGLRFEHLPVTPDTRSEQEARFKAVIDEADAELVVLARYMQILSDRFAATLEGRCINIHHSFLPGFKGAKPYHQAYRRGVKIIGATAHYVTADLDEGPIIEQEVERVDHTMTPEQLVDIGRDIESRVLVRAVRWHAQHRILPNNDRTVVFK